MENQDQVFASWNEAMHSFKLLSPSMQQILRRCATERLVDSGCEEVGSSDCNAELVAMWRIGGRNWNQVVLNEFEAFAAAHN